MKIHQLQYVNIYLLAISMLLLASCIEDEDNQDNSASTNTYFEIDGIGELEGRGDFVSQYLPELELYVTGFDIWDNSVSTAAEAQFLVGIQIYDENEIELTTGLYSLRQSYLAGGELGRMGVGLTWWDEDRSATIYSEVENGFLRIQSISNERIQGQFSFDVKSPATGELIKVREGRFNIRR